MKSQNLIIGKLKKVANANAIELAEPKTKCYRQQNVYLIACRFSKRGKSSDNFDVSFLFIMFTIKPPTKNTSDVAYNKKTIPIRILSIPFSSEN